MFFLAREDVVGGYGGVSAGNTLVRDDGAYDDDDELFCIGDGGAAVLLDIQCH